MKECPFCGSKNVVAKKACDIADSWCMSYSWTVECQHCYAMGPFKAEDADGVKTEWNGRA